MEVCISVLSFFFLVANVATLLTQWVLKNPLVSYKQLMEALIRQSVLIVVLMAISKTPIQETTIILVMVSLFVFSPPVYMAVVRRSQRGR